MIFETEENGGAAGARGLLDEIRNAVAQRVDLKQKLDVELLALAQLDQPVKMGCPVAVAAKLSSVTKNRVIHCAALARTIASTSSGVR